MDWQQDIRLESRRLEKERLKTKFAELVDCLHKKREEDASRMISQEPRLLSFVDQSDRRVLHCIALFPLHHLRLPL